MNMCLLEVACVKYAEAAISNRRESKEFED